MSRVEQLSKRERRVLDAVIQSYVETAEPAGSRTLARRFGLGGAPATIRNTMSDLEEKGFRVLRFRNQDVLENMEGVLEEILRLARVHYPSP